jgi:N-acyl homoserine lactone hydrolase
MATHAVPQPAALPLPGRQDDARVRLHPLLSATAKLPRAWFFRPPGRFGTLQALGIRVPKDGWTEFPVVAFLIEHPGAGAILIDTGFHPSVAVEPRQNLGRLNAFGMKEIQMSTDQAVPAQLRARAIQPAEVRFVLMTHFHADHASAMSEFPSSTFLFTSREWEAATAPRAVVHGYVARQFDHAFDYRTLDFDSGATESFASFGRSFDLFGDGSVRALFTPGHTHGHMSFALRTRDREVLVAGDAIYALETLRTGQLPFKIEDEHLFGRSLREIELYAEQTPDALIIPGHDLEAWRALNPSY